MTTNIAAEIYNKLMDIAQPVKDFGLCFYVEDLNEIFKNYGVEIDE